MSQVNTTTESSEPKTFKLTKKQKRLLKNKSRQEDLSNELSVLIKKSEEIMLANSKIIMYVKEAIKIYPHEVKEIEKQTQLKLENLIKSGTKISKQGFDLPVSLSSELNEFLNMKNADTVTRIEVVRKITKYIREKKLQDPRNRRLFNPDSNLKNIFNITDETNDTFTYTNINKLIEHHLEH